MSPVLVQDVVQETIRQGLVAIPGAATPSEVFNCFVSGASLVKVFPVESFGMQFVWHYSITTLML